MNKERLPHNKLSLLVKHSIDSVEFVEYVAMMKKLTIEEYCKILRYTMEYHYERVIL